MSEHCEDHPFDEPKPVVEVLSAVSSMPLPGETQSQATHPVLQATTPVSPRKLCDAAASCGTIDTDEESDLESREEDPIPPRPSLRRSLTWSDHSGHQLFTVHSLQDDLEPHCVRIVVLLIHDHKKKFEFLHCEFQTEDRLSVRDVLEQLPYMAVTPALRDCRYTSMIREAPPHDEFINICSLSGYGLRDGEIVVAVNRGSHPRKDGLKQAHKLLKGHHRMLRKAAKKARIMGRALQLLQGSKEWAVSKAKRKEERKVRKKKGEKQSATKEEEKEGFLSRKVLREHRKLMDAVETERRKRRRRRPHRRLEVVIWIRTSRLRRSFKEHQAKKLSVDQLSKEVSLAKELLKAFEKKWKPSHKHSRTSPRQRSKVCASHSRPATENKEAKEARTGGKTVGSATSSCEISPNTLASSVPTADQACKDNEPESPSEESCSCCKESPSLTPVDDSLDTVPLDQASPGFCEMRLTGGCTTSMNSIGEKVIVVADETARLSMPNDIPTEEPISPSNLSLTFYEDIPIIMPMDDPKGSTEEHHESNDEDVENKCPTEAVRCEGLELMTWFSMLAQVLDKASKSNQSTPETDPSEDIPVIPVVSRDSKAVEPCLCDQVMAPETSVFTVRNGVVVSLAVLVSVIAAQGSDKWPFTPNRDLGAANTTS